MKTMSDDVSKRDELYIKQVELLKTFLKTGAITQAQFDHSFNCLRQKMYPEGVSAAPSLDNDRH